MTDLLESRVDALERQVALLSAALQGRTAREPLPAYPAVRDRREVPAGPPSLAHLKSPAPDVPAVSGPAVAEGASRQRFDIEELLGGRLLALVGGVAVIIGIAFFVALAINAGWVDETARMLLSVGGSLVLFAGGVWLYEHKGRSQAALAMVATGITGIFLSLSAATVVYDLIPPTAALPIALGIGALASAVAVRWDSRTVAALAIGGTVLTPSLSETFDATSMVFLAVAAASGAGVMVWRRWPGLAFAVSALTLGQVSLWTASQPADAQLVGFLCVFAAVNLALMLGYELRDTSARLQPWSVLLVPFGALVLGALGYYGLPHGRGDMAGGLWLLALAAAHGGAAVIAVVLRRAGDEVVLVLLGAAVVLADVAFGSLGSGWVLGAGWAASSVGFAVVARRTASGHRDILQLTVGGQLALAVGHVLLFDARPQQLVDGPPAGPAAVVAIVAVLVAAFSGARLAVDESPQARVVLDSLSMAALAYVTTLSLDGTALLLAWAAAAALLARASVTFEDRVPAIGALSFLGLIIGHLLVVEAPPASLVYGVPSPVNATVALVLAAGVAVVCTRTETVSAYARPALLGLSAMALLYLGSVLLVSAFQPEATSALTTADGGARQQGQALVSALWGVCGISALWAGLWRDHRLVRLAGLGLLCLAASKVFLYDLSALSSVYRVASFVVLGLLLLGAAFVHQRLHAKTSALPPTPVV